MKPAMKFLLVLVGIAFAEKFRFASLEALLGLWSAKIFVCDMLPTVTKTCDGKAFRIW